jgi:hypothetical protein
MEVIEIADEEQVNETIPEEPNEAAQEPKISNAVLVENEYARWFHLPMWEVDLAEQIKRIYQSNWSYKDWFSRGLEDHRSGCPEKEPNLTT